MAKRIVFHRDHTFWFNGERFRISYGGPGYGYEVSADNEFWSSTDLENHHTLSELRAELERRLERGQSIRILLPGDTLTLDGRRFRNGELYD